jgi:hypothetical protein
MSRMVAAAPLTISLQVGRRSRFCSAGGGSWPDPEATFGRLTGPVTGVLLPHQPVAGGPEFDPEPNSESWRNVSAFALETELPQERPSLFEGDVVFLF